MCASLESICAEDTIWLHENPPLCHAIETPHYIAVDTRNGTRFYKIFLANFKYII